MTAASPFRWLLTLLAMVLPVTAPTDRPESRRSESAIPQVSGDHVVFRHYL
ncbi:hypothetical protein [Methylobacterium sp. J-068]|uniref:hypothetical protein n=1 Tax=Methylobacterium sp. J-068 TaxID=2836649 RepID=UPI001FBB2661|nr:hypothetical protein [Methylobacterium sp. J-068]MCJ2033236.1 hypothetical protein [Methylobacterium sp. J-068]